MYILLDVQFVTDMVSLKEGANVATVDKMCVTHSCVLV